MWHRRLQLIDHGATLVFHHDWPRAAPAATRPYDVSDHVLVAFVTAPSEAAEALAPQVTVELVSEVVAVVPDEWLDEPGFRCADEVRAAYVDHFLRRVAAREVWQP